MNTIIISILMIIVSITLLLFVPVPETHYDRFCQQNGYDAEEYINNEYACIKTTNGAMQYKQFYCTHENGVLDWILSKSGKCHFLEKEVQP